MTHTTKKQIKTAYEQYLRSDLTELYQCYGSYSTAKAIAYQYCIDLMNKYNGHSLRILGYNCTQFSVGFLATIDNEEVFVYVTKSYDRYIKLSEL